MPLKLLVLGHGRHGKDTVCELIQKHFNLSFVSSSWFACEKAVFPHLSEKYSYESVEQCYENRHKHRAEWYNLIADYNLSDPARLGKEIFNSYDIYCGLRNIREFNTLKELSIFDYAIWVDASERLPKELEESITIPQSKCDLTIPNNSTLLQLEINTIQTMSTLQEIYEKRTHPS